MIISASRRTDVPAFFADWFINRLKNGSVCYRNPMNSKQVTRLILTPDTVECIVFWSKNPLPLIERLDEMEALGYRDYYFQFTLNDYPAEVESNIPELSRRVDTFLRLSERVGKQRVVWRYDPIILGGKFGPCYHQEKFFRMAEKLKGAADTVIISFLDGYQRMFTNTRYKGMAKFASLDPSSDTDRSKMIECAEKLARMLPRGMKMKACAEPVLSRVPKIDRASCIDLKRIEAITGKRFDSKLAGGRTYQRKDCGCAKSYDVGALDTCRSECVYCYATDIYRAKSFAGQCDKNGEFICGGPEPGDKVSEKKEIWSDRTLLDFVKKAP